MPKPSHHGPALRDIDRDGLRLATQAFGRPGDPALLLVMGATASMLGWPDEFCMALADHGLRVIRFDHRDTGASTTVPPGAADYAVEDMADDILAIADAFCLDRLHLVGMSLGGYLAQMMAVAHPDRIASLTLIAAEPLGWDGPPLPGISPAFLDHFQGIASLDWSNRSAVTAFLVRTQQLCCGSADPFDPAAAAAHVARVLSRTGNPASMFNHATLTLRRDWTGCFRTITQPVLVLHGTEDPVLPLENGRAIAAGIPGAVLVTLPGMGHELPPARIAEIAGHVATHVRNPARRTPLS